MMNALRLLLQLHETEQQNGRRAEMGAEIDRLQTLLMQRLGDLERGSARLRAG
jgi:hypothetical protein